ncbi:MAG TPA: hypothetical protein VFE82_11085 [Ramlibacter sp.]|jgi:hypothetical protein|uniref:hypothetical protein n=1 Tax=Ramlibacter sp. TaxID=1917967 RepID=UPI002D2A9139|nr:hypothetical protein [Ramlibacter sp.]HZY19017.1 hypothetical protein [Ramlibacter sp.]
MSSVTYHALWLLGALALIALGSALITRHLRLREWRRQGAEDALEALARYCEWLAEQRRSAGFSLQRPGPADALAQLRSLQQARFPQLAPAMVQLLAVHARTLDFLWRQQLLRLNDPEAWLESDHDGRFMALWREHRAAVHALADLLRERAGGPLHDAEPESVFPA